MFQTVKNVLSVKTKLSTKVTALTIAAMSVPVLAFADITPTPAIDFVGPITSSVGGCVTNTIALFSAILPIGITIFTAKFAWVKSIAFFSKIAK